MSLCLIGVGSNLGNRQQNLDRAVQKIGEHPSVELLRTSNWRSSEPIGGPDGQEAFLNGAISVKSSLAPPELLEHLLDVERSLGRKREVRWAPRKIDLDLLLVDGQVVDEPGLCVPHPWMAIRPFVMEPAAEIEPELIHPATGWSLQRLWTHLQRAPKRVLLIAPTVELIDIAVEQAQKVLPIELPCAQAVTAATRSPLEKLAAAGPKIDRSIFSHHGQPWNIERYPEHTGLNPAHEFARPPQTQIGLPHRIEALRGWLEEAPPAKLRIILHSTLQDQWLVDTCTAPNSGPFLVLDANNTKRMQHDFLAALEGMN